jgi:hypothetical protein
MSYPYSFRLWQDGATGLILAAQYGSEAVVQLLLENKAELNATDQACI